MTLFLTKDERQSLNSRARRVREPLERPMSLPIEMDFASLHDAIPSPFEDGVEEVAYDADVEINDRRARAENAEALRLARAL